MNVRDGKRVIIRSTMRLFSAIINRLLQNTMGLSLSSARGVARKSNGKSGIERLVNMISFPNKKYQLIYTDPPWRQSKGGKKSVRRLSSGGKLDYQVISLEDIKHHLASIKTEPNSVLFLWAIDKYLFEAEQIAKDLGYKLHARMVWNKVTGIPAAFTVRFGHEYLLYMYKGKFTPISKPERGKIHTVFTEQVKKHSQKPVIARQIINRLYPELTKLEMYARIKKEIIPDPELKGWDFWGDEV